MREFLLAVPSDILRAGIKTKIKNFDANYQVVASVSTLNGLREAAKKHPFATVVLHSQLAGDGTIDGWRRLYQRYGDLQLILWCERFQDVLDFQCNVPNVEGFLMANATNEELEQACANVSRGQMFVAADIAEYLARNPRTQEFRDLLSILSRRELQVAQMIAKGILVGDIAKHLNISTKTVNTFRYRIFDKLGITGDVALTHIAIRSGLVDIESERRYGK